MSTWGATTGGTLNCRLKHYCPFCLDLDSLFIGQLCLYFWFMIYAILSYLSALLGNSFLKGMILLEYSKAKGVVFFMQERTSFCVIALPTKSFMFKKWQFSHLDLNFKQMYELSTEEAEDICRDPV